MSALVRKEIRLLLPAWISAMLLVMAPILLGRVLDDSDPTGVTFPLTVYGVAIGCVILGLTGFGLEMSSRTFSFLLAQPRPRGEYWRAKVGVLLGSLVPLALFLGLVSRHFVPPDDRWEIAFVWFITACVAVTGGLWTTLLFRQIVASFWISVLLPSALLALALQVEDKRTHSILATVLLLAYSLAGYLFAKWQFRYAQDTAWTGGEVSLPSVARWLPWMRTANALQKSHPFRALLAKEFQFQQVNFLIGGLLLLVQVVMFLLQKFANLTGNSVLQTIVEAFWAIWIVMPLLVGCGSVAEERKLGTLESQLCLPVPRAWQFAIKVFVTLVCSLVLGALVPVAISVFNPTRGMNWQEFALPWTLACVCLALVSFYASTLTHQILQAFGATIGIIVVFLFLGNLFAGTFSRGHEFLSLFGANLWRGPLILFVGGSVMLVFTMFLTWRRLRWIWLGFLALITLGLWGGQIQLLLAFCLSTNSQESVIKPIVVTVLAAALCPVALTLALAAQNFKHTQTSLSLWWRNATIWLGCFFLTGVITWLVYNRVWELAMRFEPPAGAPRLSGPIQPIITGLSPDIPTFVLLPDGRLYSFRSYEIIPKLPTQTNTYRANESEAIWRMLDKPRVEFVGGSNWVAIGTTGYEFAGVKADGSLWRANWFEWVDRQGNTTPASTGQRGEKGATLRRMELKFERVGSEPEWAAVAASGSHVIALKRGGTIWGWGNNQNEQLGAGPALVGSPQEPKQIDPASNWTAVYAGNGHSYAVNRDGEIWRWGRVTKQIREGNTVTELLGGNGPVKLPLNVPGVRNIIGGINDFDLILDTDGNLWGRGNIPPILSDEGYRLNGFNGLNGRYGLRYFAEPQQLAGTNWSSVRCNWNVFAGIKTDGTLWIQRGNDSYNLPVPTLIQYGKRTDWIAVMSDWQGNLALAKDGTICRFGEPLLNPQMELLAPTRRVTWNINLLDVAK